MFEITRYPITTLPFMVTMPSNSKVLTVKVEDDGNVYLYALVDNSSLTTESKTIQAYNTNTQLESKPYMYITSLMYKGNMTHFFKL